MPIPQPKFLYFDLGNVLLTFCNDRMCTQMSSVVGVTADAIRSALLDGEAESIQWRFERGDLSADDYYRYVCDTVGGEPIREALEHAACDIFDVIEPSQRIVEQLAAAGARLGILSNTNEVHWRFVTDGRYPHLVEPFEHAVLSFEAKAMKPDARIYQVAAERAGAAPADVFFVDDRPENVAGAREYGLDAVQFTSPQALAADLRDRGFEINP